MKPDTHFDLVEACPRLQLGEDGIFYAAGSEAISYPEEGNEACFQIEDQSFWFRHRNDCIRELVRSFPPKGNGPIFDVGGGNGFVAKGLMDSGWEVVLVEPGPSGARNAKKRGLKHVICGTTHSAGFKNGSLPAIGFFDVVEHIEDDIGFLRHLWDLLELGGILYLTVPAFNFLWSHEDVNAGHFRRYTLGEMEKKLLKAGLEPVFETYIFGFLPLPVFLFRTLSYRLGVVGKNIAGKEVKSDHSQKQGLLGAMMARSFASELNRIRAAKSLAFGGSCMVAARKNGF
jgi:SAM-dependent methyltransferase